MSTIYAAVVAVFRGSKILMLKRRPDDRNYTGWCLPGGSKEKEDANLEQTAKRELVEETGFTDGPGVFRYRLSTIHAPKGLPLRINVYSMGAPKGDVELSDEHTEFRWVTLEEALQLDLAGTATREILRFFTRMP